MDNLTSQLNEQQLKDNIDALIKQNVPKDKIQTYVNKYKKDASGNYTLGGTSPTSSPDKPGIFERAGTFVAKDTLGIGPQDNSGGFAKDIFQSTVGSKGLAGVAQLPGKVASAVSEYAPIIGKHQGEELYKQASDVSTQAYNWIKKANQTEDPTLKQHYLDLGKQLQDSSRKLMDAGDNLGKFTDTTGKEALGTAANAATTVASFGAGSPLSSSKIIVDEGAKEFAKSVGVAAAKNFAVGVGYGAGSDLLKNKDTATVAKDAFISGLTNSVVQTGLSTAAAGTKVVAKKTAEELMSRAINLSKKVKVMGKDPSRELLDNGVWGTLGSMYRQVKAGIEQSKADILPKLESTPGGMSEAEVRNGIFATLKKQVGSLYSDKEINAMVNQVPLNVFKEASKQGIKEVPWVVANNVRSQLDSELGDRFWMSNANPTLAKRASEAAANFMRRTIQGATGTAEEFAHESKYITARKAIWSALNNKKIGLTDILFAGAGFASGGSLEDRAKKAGEFVATEKIARSSLGKSASAQILDKGATLGSKVAGSAIGRGVKTVISKAVTKLTSGK